MDLQAEAVDVLARLVRFDAVNPPGNDEHLALEALRAEQERSAHDAGVADQGGEAVVAVSSVWRRPRPGRGRTGRARRRSPSRAQRGAPRLARPWPCRTSPTRRGRR